jgi:hypothetical protein
MKVLVGSTGLIGSALQEQTSFDRTYSSSNFREITTEDALIDHLVLCCLPAAKWKVNQDPLADLENIFSIVDILDDIQVDRVTLISTIDVYGHECAFMDEIITPSLKKPGYGPNRLLFETLVKERLWCNSMQIVRLPALFHRLIKKNILFDLINNHEVEKINANSCYQWYPLDHLWEDLSKCPGHGIANLFPAPIETELILDTFFPWAPKNMGNRIEYNHFTMHTKSAYWPPTRSEALGLIGDFIDEARS